jgi:hypothetical protein
VQVRIIVAGAGERDRFGTPLHPRGMLFPFLVGRAERDPGNRVFSA